MSIRLPAQAGAFYPSGDKEIAEFFGSVPEPEKKDAVCAIVPHAGWIYSGSTALKALKNLAPASTVIMLGPDHYGISRRAGIYPHDCIWKLPNGELACSPKVKEMKSACPWLSEVDIKYDREHSLEVLLPFLIEHFGSSAQLVPLIMYDYEKEKMNEIAEAVLGIIREGKGSAALIGSSDFSHFVPAARAQKNDMLVIDRILALDHGALHSAVKENDVSMCGLGPVYITTFIAASLGLRPELLEYTSSGAVTGDDRDVVAYAGIVFRK